MNLFYQPLISEGVHHLDESESKHLVKVLRKRPGDLLHVTDGLGNLYDTVIERDDPKATSFRIIGVSHTRPKPYRIHIAISPVKNAERLEWFVEKCTELHIDEITLVNCDRTEKHHVRLDRLQKIAVSAIKQSLNYYLPLINGPITLGECVDASKADARFIAHVDASNNTSLMQIAQPCQSYLVLIGPEGDFTDAEVAYSIDHGVRKVSLGPSRLRTETAGIAACHILNLVNT